MIAETSQTITIYRHPSKVMKKLLLAFLLTKSSLLLNYSIDHDGTLKPKTVTLILNKYCNQM